MNAAEQKETEAVKKAKYALIYAKDVSIPRGADPENTVMVHFHWIGALAWYVMRNPTARAAIKAERFQLIKIGRGKKPA